MNRPKKSIKCIEFFFSSIAARCDNKHGDLRYFQKLTTKIPDICPFIVQLPKNCIFAELFWFLVNKTILIDVMSVFFFRSIKNQIETKDGKR